MHIRSWHGFSWLNVSIISALRMMLSRVRNMQKLYNLTSRRSISAKETVSLHLAIMKGRWRLSIIISHLFHTMCRGRCYLHLCFSQWRTIRMQKSIFRKLSMHLNKSEMTLMVLFLRSLGWRYTVRLPI